MSKYEILKDRLDIVMAYRRLFLDENGRLKEDARIVFSDIRVKAALADYSPARDNAGRIDPSAHVYRDGQRALFEHINRRVSEDPAAIMDRMKEE